MAYEFIEKAILRIMENAKGIDDYDHVQDRYVRRFIETAVERKADLLEVFRKHPNWNEETLRITLSVPVRREMNARLAADVIHKICAHIRVHSVSDAKALRKVEDQLRYWPELFYQSPTIGAENACQIASIFRVDAPPVTKKTTRVLRKLLADAGYEKPDSWLNNEDITDVNGRIERAGDRRTALRLLGEYADAMSPLSIDRPLIISVNPFDFLTCSLGNSWSSCHNPFPELATAGDYSGCWCAGPLDYALDTQSFVVMGYKDSEHMPPDDWFEYCTNRIVCAWNGQALLLSREYPMGRDGDDSGDGLSIKKGARLFLEELFAKEIGERNLWRAVPRERREYKKLFEDGKVLHYMDYIHYNDIEVYELSDATDPEATQTFTLGGSKPICMVCGSTLVSEEYPICCGDAGGYRTCDRCGERVREEDGRRIPDIDEFWCDDRFGERYCVCDRCEAVVDLDEVYEHNGYHYCEDCAVDCGYAVRCDGCGNLFDSDDVQSFGDYTYCDSCVEENTFVCPECGERCSNEDKECLTDGTEICHDCAEANHERCPICNRYVDSEEYDENGGVCSTCKAAVDRGEYRQCDICGNWYKTGRTRVLSDGKCVCGGCMFYYCTCPVCGLHLPRMSRVAPGFSTTCQCCGSHLVATPHSVWPNMLVWKPVQA